jgi:hypothetical protein
MSGPAVMLGTRSFRWKAMFATGFAGAGVGLFGGANCIDKKVQLFKGLSRRGENTWNKMKVQDEERAEHILVAVYLGLLI